MTEKFSGFFEIVYPFNSEYNKISEESVFNDFLPTTNSYISRTSFDYVSLEKLFNDATDILKKEKTRLEKLFKDCEFNIVFSPGECFDDFDTDDDEDLHQDDSLDLHEVVKFEADFEEDEEQESDNSLGSLVLRNEVTGDIVCHIELFSSDFGDDDFAPSFHYSATIH